MNIKEIEEKVEIVDMANEAIASINLAISELSYNEIFFRSVIEGLEEIKIETQDKIKEIVADLDEEERKEFEEEMQMYGSYGF